MALTFTEDGEGTVTASLASVADAIAELESDGGIDLLRKTHQITAGTITVDSEAIARDFGSDTKRAYACGMLIGLKLAEALGVP